VYVHSREREGDTSMLSVDKPISPTKSGDLVITKHGCLSACFNQAKDLDESRLILRKRFFKIE
jgi:hypothetical protein